METPYPGRDDIGVSGSVLDGEHVNVPRILDAALEAAEMGPWRYTFADFVCYLSPRAQMLYGIDQSYFVRDEATIRRLLHPDDFQLFADALRGACAPGSDGRYTVEYRVRRAEGGWRWLSVWGIVEFDGDGADRRPVSMTGASRDITPRKQAEMFSNAQKESLELIVRGAPLGDVLSHLTRIVERQSDDQVIASILFLDEEGCLRTGAAPSLPADYVQMIDGLKADANVGTCSAAAATCRTVITTDIDTDPGWTGLKHLPLGLGLRAAWSQPIRARDGHVLGTFGTYFRSSRGPTETERETVEILSRIAALAIERARADEALRESERTMREDDHRKNEFLAALSHELRNPMAPLKTAIQLLQQNMPEQSRARLVRMMERQFDQLVTLVDDLLDVSRITRGALQMRMESLDLASVIALAIETSEPVMKAGQHTFSADVPGGTIEVYGDKVRLAQILSNLLNNAAKYTDPGGRITLKVQPQASHVRVAVRDTGVGFDPVSGAKLFELFARGPHAAGRHKEGLGVGLALARRLAEMHSGSLDGVSEGHGRGSEFVLRLPLAKA